MCIRKSSRIYLTKSNLLRRIQSVEGKDKGVLKMSVLLHYSDLVHEETIRESGFDYYVGEAFRFTLKVGRTVMRCGALVKFFGEGNAYVEMVDLEDEKVEEIWSKKFPEKTCEETYRQIANVSKHSLRVMLEKKKEQYTFRIV